MMMFRGMGGGQQQMSRPRGGRDRAIGDGHAARERPQKSADSMGANYR